MLAGLAVILGLASNAYAAFPTPGTWNLLDGGNNNACYGAQNDGGNTIWTPCPGITSGSAADLCLQASLAFASPGQANPALLQSPGTLSNPLGSPPNRQWTCTWVYNGFVSHHPVFELVDPSNPAVCPRDSAGTSTCTCNDQTLELSSHCVGGKGNGKPCPFCGNPINPGTGNKFELQPIYRGLNGFELALSYNTKEYNAIGFGTRWRNSFDRRVALNDATHALVLKGDGKAAPFTLVGGAWNADAETAERLVELKSGSTRTGWKFTSLNADDVETFDAAGKLLAIKSRAGLTQSLQYSDGTGGTNGGFVLDGSGNPTATPLPAGLLIRASDGFGRTLSFGYDSASRVTRVTDPAGGVYQFAYDTGSNLASITFPQGAVRTFAYNESGNTGGASLPKALTGLTDENGHRFATWKYDSQERAVSSEHAAGAELNTLVYNADGSATVSDALGSVRTYSFQHVFAATKNTAITGAVCPACGPASQTLDANGNVASRTDWNGNRTNYQYDLTRNLETQRVEALTSSGANTPQTRTITTQWHATWRLPTAIAEPLRITTNVYDLDGSLCGAPGALCSRTIQATTDANGSQALSATVTGTPRIWTYTYNAHGLPLAVDGPRTDVPDVTTYTYYADDDADLGKRGNVATIRNAASHLTSITAYNAHGQPLTIIDPNGMTTTLTYDERLRLKSRNVGGEVTSYDYDDAGQLTKVTLPDGSFLSYAYDAAHRLTGLADNLGNSLTYTLDAMGNRTHEEVRDPANSLAQTRSRVYNNLNRLFQEIGAQNQTATYAYDDQGNVTSVTDPLNHVTSNQYDGLNRLKQVTDAGLGVTQYAYNGLDALVQVTDPRNLVTGYSVDGLGNLTLQSSPDTGSTTNTYDAAANLLTQTDAKSQTTSYAYDVLNRVTLITFHDGSKQAYVYDQNTNGIGRLSSITETDAANNVTSVISYGYDLHGRVTSETRTVGGMQYVTGYTYDASGRMTGMTYPSGRTVAYTLDLLGRVTQIDTAKANQSQTVVSGVTYQPFGGVKSFTFGNGQVYTRSYDQDSRIASYTLGDKTYGIGYDAASRIEFIADTAVPANSNSYGYDLLDRLTSGVTPSTSYSYTYDAVGNRLTKVVGAGTDTYTYSPSSNRIASITPASGPLRNFAFDANGSTTADGNNTYVYDTRGRMAQATSSVGATSYQVNALGQRVRKTNTSTDRVFQYDIRGHLIAEADPGGVVTREIIYLGDMPVGVVQ